MIFEFQYLNWILGECIEMLNKRIESNCFVEREKIYIIYLVK